jgi:hypothetical protein
MGIPLVIGGGIWAYRGYKAYRAARLAQAAALAAQAARALEAISAAQANANAEAAAQEKAKTDAQAKADAAAGCKGGNCDPDSNCEKWREDAKNALYGVKKPRSMGGDGRGPKGLVQGICEWINGKDPDGGGHKDSIENAVRAYENAMKKLKNKRQFRCPDTKDLEAEAEPILKKANGKADLPHTHDPDYKRHCYEKSLAIAKRFMGGA